MGFGSFFRAAVSIATKVFKVNPIVSLVISVGIAWLIRPKTPEIPDFGTNDFDQYEKGILLNKQSNDANIPVIYGERMIGGTRVFMETSGTDNEFLYMAIILSEGEINDITEIRIDDKVVTWSGDLADNTQRTVGSGDSNFYKDSTSLITVEPHYGTDGQSSSSLLSTLSSWGSNHKLSGLCYLALKFKWSQDAFTGVPKVQSIVQGKKVVAYNSSSVAQTAAFSNNPAWCLLDYLTNERYGKGLAIANIDIPSFYTASGICDTDVTAYGATTINVMDCNAIIDTSSAVIDNVREFLKGCRGYLPYVGGKYKLICETTGSSSITVTEDDIIGGYTLASPSKNSKYNRVIISYVNPARNYQVDEVQFPEIDDSSYASADKHAAMKTVDGEFLLEGRFDMKTITSPYQALELAEVILRRSREALGLTINVSFSAYDVAIGDILGVTHSSLGFSNKQFRVLGINFNADFTLGLDLMEHQDSHYTWATKTQVASTPSTNLPNPFIIQPPTSVTLTDDLIEYNDGTVITRLNVLIGASTDLFIDQYEVELRQDTDRNGDVVVDDFKIVGRGITLRHQVLNVIDNSTYTIRVRGINALGVKSTYLTAQRQIIGQTAVPQDVENFAINVLGDQALLSWSAIPDLDLNYYVLKFSTDLVNPTWQNSVDLVDRIGRPATSLTLPLLTGSYLIKAQDKLGNQSSNETIVTTNIASVNFVNQTTINEHTAFTGTKTNVETVIRDSTNYIGLTATGTVGDTATRVPATGTYEFANTIDLGDKFKGQFTASVIQFIEDVSEVIDNGRPDATTLFDDGRPNPFDGTSSGDAHTILEISTSDDNVTFSAFKPFTIGEHIGRYFKFRVLFKSDNLKARCLIEELTVIASLSKRNESGNDISSGTGGKAVTFNFGFKLNPAIGVSAQSMANGDYYTITSKSTTGFTIEFFNSSATSIDRTFDYIVQGVGQIII
jgi:hypothetical protein